MLNRSRYILYAVAGLLIGLTAANAWLSLTTWGTVNHVSGSWLALTGDLTRDGVLYRPLLGPLGYGGTRDMPLYAVLTTGLIKCGLAPVAAGQVLSLAASLLLLLAAWRLLIRLGVTAPLALAATMMMIGSLAFRWGLTAVRPDALAAALSFAGLAVITGEDRPSPARLASAGLLFGLAWLTKATAIYGPAAGLAWLWSRGDRRQAVGLAGWTGLAALILVGAAVWASQGRMIEVLSAGLGGGADWPTVIKAPLHLVAVAKSEDPAGFVLILLGLAALAAGLIARRFGPAWWLFLFTLGMTIVIFASPGTDFNHLLDLNVAAVVAFTAWLSRRDGPTRDASLLALALAGLISLGWLGGDLAKAGTTGVTTSPRRAAYREAAHRLEASSGPILAEDPLIPQLIGRSPWVADCFMFHLLAQTRPDWIDRMNGDLAARRFPAVVIYRPGPDNPIGRARLDDHQFYPGFSARLLDNYRPAWQGDRYQIWRPR